MTTGGASAAGPGEADWDYAAVARGEPGDDDYESDAWVLLCCEVPGCEWEEEADWSDLEESPPAPYRAHWAEKHACGSGRRGVSVVSAAGFVMPVRVGDQMLGAFPVRYAAVLEARRPGWWERGPEGDVREVADPASGLAGRQLLEVVAVRGGYQFRASWTATGADVGRWVAAIGLAVDETGPVVCTTAVGRPVLAGDTVELRAEAVAGAGVRG